MKLPEPPPPTLRLRLDRNALAENWRYLDQLSGSAETGAAVKANGYGLGIGNVASVLRSAGCRTFLVAHWTEVPAAIEHIPPAELAVLHGPISHEEVTFARATGVRPVINSLQQAAVWTESGGGLCDLMIDTGMNRLGVELHELGDPSVRALELHTVMSHLASADEDSSLNATQLERFRTAAREFPGARLSLANSAGIALGRDYAFDLTRPGLALYGGVARPELAGHIRQVAFPQAAILQIRMIEPGESIGYNATFVADRSMKVATVCVGYADGFLRSWADRGYLLASGVKLPLLGRVSMDMVVVDLAKAPDLREGDWLELPYDLAQAASISGLSQYEILTGLGPRMSIRN